MNCLDKLGGKRCLVCHFSKKDFWKCIGLILSAVNYGNKGQNILGETKAYVNKRAQTPIHSYACGNKDLLKVHCDICCHN